MNGQSGGTGELVRRLADLGRELDYPPAPDLLGAVAERLERRPRRRLRLAVALAALAAALFAVVLASSPRARSSFLELFRIGGATISRVEELPRGGARAGIAPGAPMTLARAQRSVAFRIRLPASSAGRQVREVLLDPRGGGIVSVVWCCRPVLVLSQFAGEIAPFFQKLLGPAARVEQVRVGGKPGYWITGGQHAVLFQARGGAMLDYSVRVAGNTLMWVDGEVTLRLEGRLTKAEALELAASVR